MGIRKELHPEDTGNRTYLPPTPHTLSRSEKQTFCKRLFNLKLPDGYSSNVANCVSVDECKIIGLKSHDCHVLMQQLLAVALRGLLAKGPRLRGIGGGVCYTKYSILTQRESNIAHLKEEQNQLKVQVADLERTINDLLKKQFQENQSEELSNIQVSSSLKSVNTNTINNKCKLLDWTGTGEVVAEGHWSSNDPKILVHHIPLGPNAVRVWVDVAMKPNAFLWRLTSDMTCIEKCVGTTLAWPCDKVVIE